MQDNSLENLVYFLEGKTYINLTNACTNRCLFCVRDIKEDVVGAKLWLGQDDIKAQDVIAQLENLRDKIGDEIIFCGYGEPLLKLDVLKSVAKYIRENFKNVKIRINTNGHASFVFQKNVPQELKELVDEISISLNAATEEEYNEISRPKIEGAYSYVKDFAKQCVDAGIKTTLSIVQGCPGHDVDAEACREIAQDLGADFRIREWIKEGY